MGLVMLCNPISTIKPYQMEMTATNLYSIEELCYYLYENLYLLEDSALNEQLCQWIEKELKMPFLAKCLLQMLHAGAGKRAFILRLFEMTGYCDEEELAYVTKVLEQMEQVSPFERAKIRADRLLENHNYAKVVIEYKKILDSRDAAKVNQKICGNIWHNMGIAYAKMFLFAEAVECFEKAYSLNFNQESYREQMIAMELLKGKEQEEERADVKEAFQARLEEAQKSSYDTDFEKCRNVLESWNVEYKKMNQR